MTYRIGFACKVSQLNNKQQVESVADLNTRSTTVTWLLKQPVDVREQRLWEIFEHNLAALGRAIEYVGGLDEHLRFYRISSDILPFYTHNDMGYFWHQRHVRDMAAKTFAEIGRRGRDLGVRLSFHPGQFTCLSSDNPDIVLRSIAEVEYHTDMARWMGYGANWHDSGFKINIHISGKQGPDGTKAAFKKLSPEARNLLTVENDENTWGLESCLELADIMPIVLDCHHHWCREGEYIEPNDDRVKQVIASWRGVRPAMHYSVSREDYLIEHKQDQLPDKIKLIDAGYKKQYLRAHSDRYWNTATNQWAASFLDNFDIMCESKHKNLASIAFFEEISNASNTSCLSFAA